MKKPILILTFLIIVIVTLFGARTIISNRISTSGLALGVTQEELASYKNQNALLREKIFGLSSLSHVSSVAARLGFVEGKTNFALTKALPIAVAR